jgi:GNAT superfamily N-acetyltransferase
MSVEQPFLWRFLEEQVSQERLLQAMVENMCQWVRRCALANAGEVHQTEEVTWAYSPGPEGDAAILFPRFTSLDASLQLDSILDYFRQLHPERDLLCWSLDPTNPPDLEARLLARGFEWNWSPHWMWLPLSQLQTNYRRTSGLHIEIVEQVPMWEAEDLPYYSPIAAPYMHQITQQEPRRVWHFAAWLDGRVVGQSRLCMTTGELGVAGIFDVGVVPTARNRGIGKALTLAACQLARSLGCQHALLNASAMGEPIYLKLGFTSLGYGKTWLLRRPVLASSPVPQQVLFIEALGKSDLKLLDILASKIDSALYTTPLASGLTPLEIAVGLQQPLAVEWLMAHDVPLDLLSTWDLGWRERFKQLLQRDPQQVNTRFGPRQLTPVHIAVERNDSELLAFLLSADPDLTLKDSDFQATALDWANFLNRTEMVLLLSQYHLHQTSRKH